MLTTKKLTSAVIGIGKMGLVHASILSTLPNVELVALCDKSNIIRKFCSKLLSGVRVVDDLAKISELDIDLVFVTTPIPSHYSIINNLLSKRESPNVFVEKTLSSSYSDSSKLCELTRNSGRVNMVGYMKRFAVTFKKAKELLNQGAIGSIYSFEAHAYSSDFYGLNNPSQESSSRGGVLSDLGSHVIDLSLWFFGDFKVQPDKISAKDIQNTVQFNVRSDSSVEGFFDVSWCKEGYHVPEFELLFNGSEGKMTVDDDVVRLELASGQSSQWYRHDLNDNVGFLLGAPEYFREDAYFVESILNGISAEPSFDNASKVDYIIGKVFDGAEKNE
jgi:predicted dehydrogenase